MEKWLSDPRTPLIMDWIGWLLMSGPVWAWIHERLSMPLVLRALKAARRRHAAMRLQLSLAARHRVHVAAFIGVPVETLDWRDIEDRFDAHQIIGRNIREGRATPKEVERWKRWEAIESKYASRFTRTSFVYFRYGVLARAWEAAVLFAHFAFVGKLGAALFTVGFLLWNLSKALSYMALP